MNNVDHLFQVQLGADDVPAPKPYPDGLLKVVSLLDGLVPSKCIYIGDSPSDGQAATSAGMLGFSLIINDFFAIYFHLNMYCRHWSNLGKSFC